jgi:hypothetical protein
MELIMKKALILIVMILVSTFAYSQPSTISYQGVLTDNTGGLLTGEQDLIFQVYNASTGGDLLATDVHNGVSISKGLFNVELNIASVDFSQEIWLEISVGGTTLTPRVKFNASGYALSSKESDPLFNASQAKNISAGEITKLNNLSGVNTGDQDLSGLASKAELNALAARLAFLELKVQVLSGANVAFLLASGASVKDLLEAGANVSDLLAAGVAISDMIGKNYQGGKIAYILISGDNGYDANVAHGIIAAPSDQSASIQWYNGSYTATNAKGTALGSGNSNTNSIVAIQGVGTYAAKLCADLELNGYSDWFLPNRDELNKLYLNRDAIGGFEAASYWTSFEDNSYFAWVRYFENGYEGFKNKSETSRVRAIRYF